MNEPLNERSIFVEALELEDPAARAAFLDETCRSDALMRRRVEALLKAYEASAAFLQTPAPQQVANHPALHATVAVADGSGDGGAPHQPGTAVQDTARQEERETHTAPALDFLSPSTKPGSLGRLDHYEALEVLGQGAFGIVLKAFDEKLHRVVAVKVLAPQLAATSPPRKRFLREARSAAAVRHENVVSIFDVQEQPVPYLVMEYVPGHSLQQRLDEHGPLDVAEVLSLGQQIAHGLAAAHAQGLVHRDIKPANILIEGGIDGRVKITDFGLARAVDDASLTQSGFIAGTPMYMAPEQARGETIDKRADLFSLGSVLYVMCSGRAPFRASTTLGVLKRVVDDTPRPIQEIIPEVPEWLSAIISRLHAKDPDDRFQSARELADVLGACLAEVRQHGKATQFPGLAALSARAPATPPPLSDFEQPAEAPRAAASIVSPPPVRRMTFVGGLVLTVLTFAALSALGMIFALFAVYLSREHRETAIEATNSTIAVKASNFNPNGDTGKIQGTWVATAGERNGGERLPPDQLSRYRMEFLVNEVSVSMPEAPTGQGTFLLDEWQKPRRIIIQRMEGPNRVGIMDGVYELEGDHLRICIGEPKDQITEFKSHKGTGILLLDLVRKETTTRIARQRVDVNGAWDAGWTPITFSHPPVEQDGGRVPVTGTYDGGAGFFEGKLDVATRALEGTFNDFPGTARFVISPDGRFMYGHYPLRKPGEAEPASSQPWVLTRSKPESAGTESDPDAKPPLAITPFGAAAAHGHQSAWARHLEVPIERTDSLGLKFSLIPPGKFMMGSTPAEIDLLQKELEVRGASAFDKFAAGSSAPQHIVVLKQPFYMAQQEVTIPQFRKFVEETGYECSATKTDPAHFTWKKFVPPEGNADNQPVCGVSWEDARAFCDWCSQREKVAYLLPTEAQWEYACRAGTQTKWSFGDDPALLSEYAIVEQKVQLPVPVGLKQANAFGLYDMHGNVDEWCLDWHVNTYYGRSPLFDPVSLEQPQHASSGRVARGGAWIADAWWSRSTTRTYDNPVVPTLPKGFRVIIQGDLKPKKTPEAEAPEATVPAKVEAEAPAPPVPAKAENDIPPQ